MKTRFSLLFQLRKAKALSNGEVPIYLKISVGDEKFELSTRQHVLAAKWNVAAQKVSGNSEEVRTINTYLKNLEQEVFQAHHSLIQENKTVNALNLKNKLQGKDSTQRFILQIFKDHNEKMKALVGKEYAKGTLDRYEISFRHTQAFLHWKYKVSDVDITQLNYEFIQNYEFWFRSVRNCDHNSTMKYLSNFKKIVRFCVKNGWLTRDPFIGFKFQSGK